MPPIIKVTRENIINAAVDIVRRQGQQALNARSIAKVLGCSTQPVFSNFGGMEELKFAVIEAADKLCNEYIDKEIKSGKYPPYKASGMAYIHFAKEEKRLFGLLYMRDRTGEKDFIQSDISNQMENMVKDNIGLKENDAKLFHLEMWAYVHGIAAMLATGFLELDNELISKMITDCYLGLKKRFEEVQ